MHRWRSLILVAVLFLMGASWFEPVLLFLLTIGIAILLNMGHERDHVPKRRREITYSIAAYFAAVPVD